MTATPRTSTSGGDPYDRTARPTRASHAAPGRMMVATTGAPTPPRRHPSSVLAWSAGHAWGLGQL